MTPEFSFTHLASSFHCLGCSCRRQSTSFLLDQRRAHSSVVYNWAHRNIKDLCGAWDIAEGAGQGRAPQGAPLPFPSPQCHSVLVYKGCLAATLAQSEAASLGGRVLAQQQAGVMEGRLPLERPPQAGEGASAAPRSRGGSLPSLAFTLHSCSPF